MKVAGSQPISGVTWTGVYEVWTKFFKNLERMPGRLADAIREDGRPVGTLSVIITKGAG